MMSKTNQKDHEMSIILLETFISKNHFMRKIDQSINFLFYL